MYITTYYFNSILPLMYHNICTKYIVFQYSIEVVLVSIRQNDAILQV